MRHFQIKYNVFSNIKQIFIKIILKLFPKHIPLNSLFQVLCPQNIEYRIFLLNANKNVRHSDNFFSFNPMLCNCLMWLCKLYPLHQLKMKNNLPLQLKMI